MMSSESFIIKNIFWWIWSGQQDDAIRNLFSTNTPHEYTTRTLLTFLVSRVFILQCAVSSYLIMLECDAEFYFSWFSVELVACQITVSSCCFHFLVLFVIVEWTCAEVRLLSVPSVICAGDVFLSRSADIWNCCSIGAVCSWYHDWCNLWATCWHLGGQRFE